MCVSSDTSRRKTEKFETVQKDCCHKLKTKVAHKINQYEMFLLGAENLFFNDFFENKSRVELKLSKKFLG